MIRRIFAWFLVLMLMVTPALADRQVSFFTSEAQSPQEIITSAMEMYSWFTISPLDVDPELTGGDGSVCRVADELLCDYGTVMRLLDFTFSPEIVRSLMEYNTYQVIDGQLYGVGGGRGIDERISEVFYEETEKSAERIVYTVTVYYVGVQEDEAACETYEFVREPVGGLWVFTQFPFFW